MSTKFELIISGNASGGIQALEALQRSGADVAHVLERDFDQLGTGPAWQPGATAWPLSRGLRRPACHSVWI